MENYESKKMSDEFFDVALSYGTELLLDGGILKTVGSDEKYKPFVDACNLLKKLELEKKAREQYSDKRFLGCWNFCICDENSKKLEGIPPIEGAVFITDVNTRQVEKEAWVGGKTTARPELNAVKLIDVVFMDVPRRYISNLLDNAQQRRLKTCDDMTLQAILKPYNLHIITSPKSIVSGCSGDPIAPGSTEMLSILAHQTVETKVIDFELASKKLARAGCDNVSDYRDIYIVISSCNILQQYYAYFDGETPKMRKSISFKDRFKNIALSLFIVNVTVSRTAKLRIIQRAISECLNKSLSRHARLSKDEPMLINRSISELTNTIHEKTFVYPVTESMAKLIYERFEINDIKAQLSDLQQAFERYMLMYINHGDEHAENKRQNILKTLTVISGISTVCSLAGFVFIELEWALRVGFFFGGVFLMAAIVYLLPIIPSRSRRKKRKNKKK